MVLWWKAKPARSSAAGIARCPPSRPSSANSPSSGAQRETRDDQRGRAVHRAAERGGELGVGDRRRPGQVDRTRHLVVRDREQQRPHLVLEADPRHVLAAVAQPGAEPEREQRLDAAENPAGRRQHQPGAHQHHPGAVVLGGRGRGLPVLAELGQETLTRQARFRRRCGRRCRRSSRPRWR